MTHEEFLALEASRSWLHRVGDATSQWINAAFLRGEPNESISGRSYREGWRIKWWIDMVLGAQHCRDSFVSDLWRARLLVERHGDIVDAMLCKVPKGERQCEKGTQ